MYTVSSGWRWNIYCRDFMILVVLGVSSSLSFPARSKQNHGKTSNSVNDFSATRYMILNIVSRTVHNVFVWVATPKPSRSLALWNCYLKSSSTKRVTSGTRTLIFTQDIVVCSVRVNWFLGSIDLVVYSNVNERGFSTEDRCRMRRNWGFWAHTKIIFVTSIAYYSKTQASTRTDG